MKISVSGARGIYNEDFTLSQVHNLTKLFSDYLRQIKKKNIRCLSACDTRPSSDFIKRVVTSTLINFDIEVYDLGIAPTPIAFRESKKYDCGIIITASHNPLNWNGLKFILDGRGIFENELIEMLHGYNHNHIDNNEHSNIAKSYQILPNYIYEISQLISTMDQVSENKKKIGLDLCGGAACNYAEELFKKFHQKSYSINGNIGISSHGPDPTSDDLIELRSLVKLNNMDFGFAFDFDGDRVVVIDRNGKKLTPDNTLLLCIASSIINFKAKKFVTSIDTSISVQKFIEDNNGIYEYSKVGESNVLRKAQEIDADACGEGSSAGFILPSFNACRDGFLASIIISLMNDRIIKDCLDLSSNYSQIRSKIPINMEVQNILMEKLENEFKKISSEIVKLDGIKIILDENSWILIRKSNTEYSLRISVESLHGRTESLAKQYLNKINEIHDQIVKRN
ncbi:MAG: phosphomannomutase [Nitrososphaeraceae archaeon]|nr:phosphomannomutase [Nitrososphaeraceae archaeon]